MAVSPSRSKSALLVIDLQLGMFNGERLAPIHAGERLLVHTQAAIEHANRSGVRVIYVRHVGSPGHLLEHGTPNWHNRLIVMGAQTEVCVDTTCRRDFTLGFGVTLVSDGHGTWDNATLRADQIIRHTNDTLAGWFVHLVRVDEVGECLQKS
jgi:nicotinamidase-related amidase